MTTRPARDPDEWADSLTHGVATALSIAALVVMVVFASLRGSARHIVGAALFGASLILLYLMSTLYHAFRGPRLRKVFKILDHSAIFILIAGTYTPFCLGVLKGAWGWTLFGVIWGLAALGVTLKAVLYGKWMRLPAPPPLDHLHGTPDPGPTMPRGLKILSTLVYLAMGWLIVLALAPLAQALSRAGLAWLFLGGACYTLGTLFYMWHSLRYHHAIWHLWVMAGSACHVFAVLWHVIPGKPGA
jgi:hemolysin III